MYCNKDPNIRSTFKISDEVDRLVKLKIGKKTQEESLNVMRKMFEEALKILGDTTF